MRALLLCIALAAPPEQGRTCAADRDCASPMTCVKTGTRRTCQIVCSPGKTNKCPEDQRCVKDAELFLCRPINDALYPDDDGNQ